MGAFITAGQAWSRANDAKHGAAAGGGGGSGAATGQVTETEFKLGHSIDFHASQTSMTNDMRTLNPGESLTSSFTAEYSGIWMYHCGTAPVLHHIGNGMYGAVVIDQPNLTPVQHEWVFVQSE